MRRWLPIAALAACGALAGCHSHYIQATITNGSGAPISVVQVDYPSASFGTQQLAPGQAFHYRFKLLGSGHVKISFIDARNGEHQQEGPWLNEGQEGTLDIRIAMQDHAEFATRLRP